jgi:hypothetical protein
VIVLSEPPRRRSAHRKRPNAAVVALRQLCVVLAMVAAGIGIVRVGTAVGMPAFLGGVGTPGSGATVTQHGDGTFQPAPGGSEPVGAGRLLRYRVEVENGVHQDPVEFARWVDRVLADQRGWTARGRWAFQRTGSGPIDFVVRLASPDTVDEICGKYGVKTDGEVSCRGAENVVINLRRWLLAIPSYNGDLTMYRHTVVNHEVGHFLGFEHLPCPGAGQPMPVMGTPYFGLHGCRPNGWPYPDAVDAP